MVFVINYQFETQTLSDQVQDFATEIMKLLPFLAFQLTSAECEVPLSARWCIDAADLEYRKCLAQFNCHVKDSVSCTDDRHGVPEHKSQSMITVMVRSAP